MSDILGDLRMANIFSVERKGNEFLFEECCDNYFTHKLSLEEMKQLIDELSEMMK